MKKFVACVGALAFLTTPGFAKNSMNRGGFEINPVDDVIYEAVSTGVHGGIAFWCASGLFVLSVLKMPPTTEIYVVRGREASVTTKRRSAALFTIDPVAAGVTPVELSNDLNEVYPGEHMAANLARNFCNG